MPQQPRPMPTIAPSAMPPLPVGNIAMQTPAALGMSMQFQPSSDPTANDLYSKIAPIFNAITEINPSYKNTVGSVIYGFVDKIVGSNFAPKITGMLIDLNIAEIRKYCTDYDLFVQRIN